MALAALGAALAALPAAAMTPGQAACPAQLAPKTLGPLLTQEMMNFKEGQAQNPAITAGVKQVLDACIKREKIKPDQEDAYTKYVIARVSHDDLALQLTGLKVPTAVLDKAFGLGLGLANPASDQITEVQFAEAISELNKAGVDIDKLPANAMQMMGAYVAVTGEMYRAMALVG